jgi:hypothetical protein
MRDSKEIEYLLRSAAGYLSALKCPSCGSSDAVLIQRKYVLTRLFECNDCRLRYRHPRETRRSLDRFYERGYAQDDGITTRLPDKGEWQAMVDAGFGEKNVDHYAEALPALFPELDPKVIRMVDYGCSWGYQTYQFRRRGIDCTGFEPSLSRASFGRRTLGLPIFSDPCEIPLDNHIFFSSHVIEHLHSPSEYIGFAFERIREGGFFVAESPNGTDDFRHKEPSLFSKLWGRVHPNFLSADFYLEAFKGRPVFLMSHPFVGLKEALAGWDRRSVLALDLSGPHLLVIARKPESKDQASPS